jgi:signal transduction histidine kinase/DNA-binding response OmpR family regulator
MDWAERLAKERRARLAAERMLEQKSRELAAATEKLALQARAVTHEIHEQRQQIASARSEAATLKGLSSRFVEDLERAHTAAVMAERRLWDSIDTFRDGFAVYDADQKLVAANAAWRAAFADLPAVRPGISYAEVLAHVAKAGLVELDEVEPELWIEQMRSRWDSDPIPPADLRLRSGVWVRMVDRRARGGDIVSLALDITGQMRLRAALDAITDGFVLYDREGRIIMCNDRHRALYPRSAEAIEPGARFDEIIRHGLRQGEYPQAQGQEAEWLAARLAAFHTPGEPIEQHVAGRWLRVIERATPDGGRVGLQVDVTDLKQHEAALEAARAGAEAANRAKSAFLANMSHEIRTPMNGVIGMAELLCDTPLSEEQRLFAETIRSSGEALLVIINDILDYSKIEAEKLVLGAEPFDLERLLHEVALLLQPRAQARGLALRIDYDMFLPTRFVGDAGRVRQVLTNLMGNAVKFTETGHVLVRISGTDPGGGSRSIHVAVEDTGIGIAPEHLEHVFGEFSQVDDAPNRRFEGTGLGLAITRGLIERMGGEVWVESELGTGSCFGFRITLPVAEDAARHPDVPVTLRRALVVDASFINRRILEHQLAAAGVSVTLCRSGDEALERLAADPSHDVALIDRALPGLDGIALARAIRAGGSRLPIMLLAADPAEAQAEAGPGLVGAILQTPVLRWDLFAQLAALSVRAAAPVDDATPGAELPHGRAMRILSAEDNRTNQLVFAKMVRDLDIDLRFADNGREAVAMCETFAPDLVFMDVSMPEMDGRAAAREIRPREAGTGQHIPIVALTAHAMEGDADGIMAAGMDAYLTKPLRKSAITEAIARFRPAEARALIGTPRDAPVAARASHG